MTFSAPTLLELLHKVYEHHGWQRVAGESRSKRVASLYDITIDGRKNRFVATLKETDNV